MSLCTYYCSTDDPMSPKTEPPSSRPLPQPPGVNGPTVGEASMDVNGEDGEGLGFQRRNAKRGMTFKPRADETPATSSTRGIVCVL